MSAVFGSNIASLRAQRLLSKTTNELARSFERLSTGMRIVKASDDAAGLAIASTLNANSRILSQASRNINDGLSMLNIADGSMEQQSNIIFRLTELAQQSASGTLSSSQRSVLNKEYQQLIREFGRLGDTTTFNGQKLLRSSHSDGASTIAIQAGIQGSSTSQIGVSLTDSGSYSGVTKYDLAGIFSAYGQTDLSTLLAEYQNRMISVRFTDNQGRTIEGYLGFQGDSFDDYSLATSVYVRARDFNFSTSNPDDYVLVGGRVGGGTAVTLIDDGTTGYRKISTNNGYTTIVLDETQEMTGSFAIDLSAMRFKYSTKVSSAYGGSSDNSTSDLANLTAIDSTGLENVDRARSALTILRARLDDLTKNRGVLGAAQTRLSVSAALSESTREATAAAESRIRDVDVADESARATALSILQQAGAAILSQANLQPQIGLSLLRAI